MLRKPISEETIDVRVDSNCRPSDAGAADGPLRGSDQLNKGRCRRRVFAADQRLRVQVLGLRLRGQRVDLQVVDVGSVGSDGRLLLERRDFESQEGHLCRRLEQRTSG